MVDAKIGRLQVYFVDAENFLLAPLLGFFWSFCRVFIRALSGRSRFNMGALHADSHELVSEESDSYINEMSVCELLENSETSIPVSQ